MGIVLFRDDVSYVEVYLTILQMTEMHVFMLCYRTSVEKIRHEANILSPIHPRRLFDNDPPACLIATMLSVPYRHRAVESCAGGRRGRDVSGVY